MAESDLSAEVNAKTVLPAPTVSDPSVDSDGNVVVPWTNTDDSSDGGIDVERSTDGFSTVTTVMSGLSPSATSYTDTTATQGITYQYRIERTTDHATATSGTVSQRAPKRMTRTATLAGDGQLDATRSGVSKTRGATIEGDGQIDTSRVTSKPRTATIEGDGRVTASRSGVSKARTATITGDGHVDATRSGVTKARVATLTGDGQLDATRVVSKARLATLQGDGQLTATRSVAKPRTATLQGDGEIEAFADFSEALGKRLSGIYIDYDTELKAFATEWYEEHPIDERQDLMSLRFTSQVETPLRFAIESDTDGDGESEHRSRWLEFEQGHVPRIYPSVPTDAVQYRVLMRGLRTQDVLRRIDTAIVF